LADLDIRTGRVPAPGASSCFALRALTCGSPLLASLRCSGLPPSTGPLPRRLAPRSGKCARRCVAGGCGALSRHWRAITRTLCWVAPAAAGPSLRCSFNAPLLRSSLVAPCAPRTPSGLRGAGHAFRRAPITCTAAAVRVRGVALPFAGASGPQAPPPSNAPACAHAGTGLGCSAPVFRKTNNGGLHRRSGFYGRLALRAPESEPFIVRAFAAN
jgi:hypothetical protein